MPSWDSVQSEVLETTNDVVRKGLEEGFAALRTHIDTLAAENAVLKEQLVRSEAKADRALAAVGERLSGFERRFQASERSRRSANLVIHGIPEQDGLSLETAVTRACREAGVPEVTFVQVSRAGQPRDGPGQACNGSQASVRPCVVQLQSVTAKHALFKASAAFRARGLKLDDDLTLEQREVRTGLKGVATALAANGQRPYWRQERMFFTENSRRKQWQAGMDIPMATGTTTQQRTRPARPPQRPAGPSIQAQVPAPLPMPPPRPYQNAFAQLQDAPVMHGKSLPATSTCPW